jgi:lipoprotein-anchoring transpeptidase ErfK/SrfK
MKRGPRAGLGAIAALLLTVVLVAPASAISWQELLNPGGGNGYWQSLQRQYPGEIRGKGVRLDRKFMRQVVAYETREAPGTIVVNTGQKFLYLVLGHGKAMRYGIGTARDGFDWSGTHRVSNKREWPGWTPPAEMKRRQPYLPAYMPGGPSNPLGARAIYIGSTLYRIHGTNEPWTIGHDVSSGCIRMVNDDVIDLYERVKVGARVVVF